MKENPLAMRTPEHRNQSRIEALVDMGYPRTAQKIQEHFINPSDVARVLDRLDSLNSQLVQTSGEVEDWYVERLADNNPKQKEVMLAYIEEAKGDD